MINRAWSWLLFIACCCDTSFLSQGAYREYDITVPVKWREHPYLPLPSYAKLGIHHIVSAQLTYERRQRCLHSCVKVFEFTVHSADWNSSSAVQRLWPHMAWWSTHLLQEFGWEVFNHHPPYSPDLSPSDFHLFLQLKKFLSGQHQRFQNDRGGDECHSGSNPRRQISMTQDTKVGPPLWVMQ